MIAESEQEEVYEKNIRECEQQIETQIDNMDFNLNLWPDSDEDSITSLEDETDIITTTTTTRTTTTSKHNIKIPTLTTSTSGYYQYNHEQQTSQTFTTTSTTSYSSCNRTSSSTSQNENMTALRIPNTTISIPASSQSMKLSKTIRSTRKLPSYDRSTLYDKIHQERRSQARLRIIEAGIISLAVEENLAKDKFLQLMTIAKMNKQKLVSRKALSQALFEEDHARELQLQREEAITEQRSLLQKCNKLRSDIEGMQSYETNLLISAEESNAADKQLEDMLSELSISQDTNPMQDELNRRRTQKEIQSVFDDFDTDSIEQAAFFALFKGHTEPFAEIVLKNTKKRAKKTATATKSKKRRTRESTYQRGPMKTAKLILIRAPPATHASDVEGSLRGSTSCTQNALNPATHASDVEGSLQRSTSCTQYAQNPATCASDVEGSLRGSSSCTQHTQGPRINIEIHPIVSLNELTTSVALRNLIDDEDVLSCPFA